MKQEELRMLAELCGYIETSYHFVFMGGAEKAYEHESGDSIIRESEWQPHKDANQFEECLFAVTNRGGLKLGCFYEHGIVSYFVNSDMIFYVEREAYKAKVLRAILKAVGEGE